MTAKSFQTLFVCVCTLTEWLSIKTWCGSETHGLLYQSIMFGWWTQLVHQTSSTVRLHLHPFRCSLISPWVCRTCASRTPASLPTIRQDATPPCSLWTKSSLHQWEPSWTSWRRTTASGEDIVLSVRFTNTVWTQVWREACSEFRSQNFVSLLRSLKNKNLRELSFWWLNQSSPSSISCSSSSTTFPFTSSSSSSLLDNKTPHCN